MKNDINYIQLYVIVASKAVRERTDSIQTDRIACIFSATYVFQFAQF